MASSDLRRFTTRGVSRRLIKTESALLRKAETRRVHEHSNTIRPMFAKRGALLCMGARVVPRGTGLRRIIIPFQVNGLLSRYVGLASKRTAPSASPIYCAARALASTCAPCCGLIRDATVFLGDSQQPTSARSDREVIFS